ACFSVAWILRHVAHRMTCLPTPSPAQPSRSAAAPVDEPFTAAYSWCRSRAPGMVQPVLGLMLLHVGWLAVGVLERGDDLGDATHLQVLLRDQLAGLGGV